MDVDQKKIVIDIWKTVIGVQQHFNDIEMKIRGIFATMVLALMAAQGFLAEKGLSFEYGNCKVLYVTFMPLFGILGTQLFYFMDKHWYHRLLVGAVLHGIEIEKRYKTEIPELSLSDSIGAASPVILRGWITKKVAMLVVSSSNYTATGALRSDGKIELFYKSIVLLFALIFVITIFFIGVLIADEPLFFYLWNQLKALLFAVLA